MPKGYENKQYFHENKCGFCGFRFWICKSCWRGQKYCSQSCKDQAKRNRHKQAQLKYSKTPWFKEDRKVYQRDYRHKKQASVQTQDIVIRCQKSNVTDLSSNSEFLDVTADVMEPTTKGTNKIKCIICGRKGFG